jgi:hypothetical protein
MRAPLREPDGNRRRERESTAVRKERSVERGKVIGNVNILDLRKATEESVQEYDAIRNVNLALYTSETAHLLHKLAIRNLNSSVEVPPDLKVETVMGPLEIGADHFVNVTEPLGLMVMGPVTIAPDVKPEDLDRGLGVALVMGPVAVPEPLAGIFQSKAQLVMGPVTTYPVLDKVHKGTLTLDRAYLDAIDSGTELVVVGSLFVPEGVPDGLIRKKLAKLHVMGKTTVFEPNATELRGVLTGTSGHVRVIPRGFKIVNKEVRLTSDLLTSLSDRKLYFVKSLVIDPDVDAALFSQKIDGLACAGRITCPQSLQPALAKVCDLLNATVLFYEGELWLVDGTTDLHPSRFDYLDGKATLVVTGVLKIAPDVSPDALAARLAKVELYGVIECSLEQQAAIESRIGASEGVFQRPGGEADEPETRIGNANYLAL